MAFNDNGLVEMPPALTWLEGSTLTCAAVTIWNVLSVLKPIAAGDVVLTRDTEA